MKKGLLFGGKIWYAGGLKVNEKAVVKHIPRTPKNYDGNGLTTRRMTDYLPAVLANIEQVYKDRPDLILASWPDVIGPRHAPQTRAVAFRDGVLHVKVKNSTLYSLLSQRDKPLLIQNLRKKFPNTPITNIVFKLG